MEAVKVHLKLHLQTETKTISFTSSGRLALIGPSGCGKSTLAKALLGLSERGEGSFHFNGTDLMAKRSWERNIAYVPQNLILMPHLSVKENLLFPVNAQLKTDVTQGLGISHLLERMPRNLSGGEKQRVALARALMSGSKLLIMDEPFSSLDFKTKEQTINFVDQYLSQEGIALLFISHEEREIELLKCERYIF